MSTIAQITVTIEPSGEKEIAIARVRPQTVIRRVACTAAAVFAGALALLQSGPAAADSLGWPQDRFDASRTAARVFGDSYRDLPRGQVAWRADIGSSVDASPVVAPAASPGTIYVGTMAGRTVTLLGRTITLSQSLVAVNPDGTRKWEISLQASGYTYKVRATPAIRWDGSLIVVGYRGEPRADGSFALKGRVFLVSPAGAILRTSDEFDGVGLSSPLIWNASFYVFGHPGYTDDLLRKFDALTFAWTSFGGIHYDVTGSSAFGGYMYVLSFLCTWCQVFSPDPVYLSPDNWAQFPAPARDAIDLEIVQPSAQTARFFSTGGRMWQKDLIGVSTAVNLGSVSYHGVASSFDSTRGRLEARNRYGTRLWAVELNGLPRAVAKGQDHLYVSATNGYLYSFTTTGQLRWSWWVGQPVGTPVVVKGDLRELVVVAGQNALWGVHSNGDLAWWPLALDSAAIGSPAVADGQVYVATQRSLYAIR